MGQSSDPVTAGNSLRLRTGLEPATRYHVQTIFILQPSCIQVNNLTNDTAPLPTAPPASHFDGERSVQVGLEEGEHRGLGEEDAHVAQALRPLHLPLPPQPALALIHWQHPRAVRELEAV
eukprot:1741043-Rhodomonas_salina.1